MSFENDKEITLLSENPTVPKVRSIAHQGKRGTQKERKHLRNGNGMEKSVEQGGGGTQKKNGKERAAGDEKLNGICTKP